MTVIHRACHKTGTLLTVSRIGGGLPNFNDADEQCGIHNIKLSMKLFKERFERVNMLKETFGRHHTLGRN